MTDDCRTFWQNNGHAYTLFQELLTRMERNVYDEEYLALLAAYREADGDAVHADVFAAHYLLANGDAEAAALCGERAFRARPIEHAAWQVLARAYMAQGRYADALIMQAYMAKLLERPLTAEGIPPEVFTDELLDRLSVAMGKAGFAPIAVSRMSYSAEQGLTAESTSFMGEFLPQSTSDLPPYYVGVYTEQEQQGNKAWLLYNIRHAKDFAYYIGGDFTFDLIRGERAPGKAEIHLAPGQSAVLPVLGTIDFQQLRVKTQSLDKETPLTIATPNFLRLAEPTEFSSDHNFIVSTPITVGHSPARRPLVLNILADALPWAIVRDHFAEWMPNTAHFFARGTVFNQHFSVAEYTHPSLPTIETGMYQHHSHIVTNNAVPVPLHREFVTLAERMRALGYATSNLMGDGIGVYNEVTRGYDRLIVTGYRLHAYEGIERTIRHLEGLRDTDQFIFLHTADAHPWPYPLFQITSSVQARLPLAERLSGAAGSEPSPYLRRTDLSVEACCQGIRDLDRALGALYRYLEEHYSPEEYLVNIYSDHGVPVFSEHHYIVSPDLTHAAWMMRGAGVPEGVVADELTSAVDIYPTLGALCGFPVSDDVDGVLPQLFGGTGREIAFSNSLYPTKNYCLRARAKTHTFHLETGIPVLPNGTVDVAHASSAIYPREHEGETGYEVDSAELRAFFYPRVREFLRGIGNNGEAFPTPKEL